MIGTTKPHSLRARRSVKRVTAGQEQVSILGPVLNYTIPKRLVA